MRECQVWLYRLLLSLYSRLLHNHASTKSLLSLHAVETPILDVDSITATTITLSWSSAGSVIDDYTVAWERQNTEECPNDDGASILITNGSTSYTIAGLEEGAIYTITVTASNIDGSAISDPIYGLTNETGNYTLDIVLLQHDSGRSRVVSAVTMETTLKLCLCTVTRVYTSFGHLSCSHCTRNVFETHAHTEHSDLI